MHVSTYQRNAHQLSLGRIHYRHHPFFGQEVEILHPFPALSSTHWIVRLQEGLRIAVPTWMLDAIFCDQLKEEASPRVAVFALLSLSDLLDHQELLSKAESCSSSHQMKGGSDATEREDTFKDATNSPLRAEGYLEASPKRAKRSVLRSPQSAAPRNNPMGSNGKRAKQQ
jgi:hypothetical protein